MSSVVDSIKWNEYIKTDFESSRFKLEQQYLSNQKENLIYNVKSIKKETIVQKCIRILKDIENDMIKFFPTGRHYFQIKMHTEMLKLCVFKILGINFNRYKGEVCRIMKWPRIPKDCFVIAARKSGKTVALYYGLAAIMMNMEEIEIVQFSPGSTQSREILNAVRVILESNAKNGDYLKPRNAGLDTIRLINNTRHKACSLRVISGHPSAINVSTYISERILFK